MSAIGELIGGVAGKVFNVFKLGAASIVSRVLGTFGLTLVSMNTLLPDIKEFIQGYVNQLPPKVLELAAALGVDVFFTMIASALVVKMAFKVFLLPKSVADNLPGGGH